MVKSSTRGLQSIKAVKMCMPRQKKKGKYNLMNLKIITYHLSVGQIFLLFFLGNVRFYYSLYGLHSSSQYSL